MLAMIMGLFGIVSAPSAVLADGNAGEPPVTSPAPDTTYSAVNAEETSDGLPRNMEQDVSIEFYVETLVHILLIL